jgi:hypothetical protein
MFSATIATLVLTSEYQFQPETRIVIAQRLAQNLKYTQSSNDRIILTILIEMTQDEGTGQSIIEILLGIGIVKKLCESLLTWLQQQAPVSSEMVQQVRLLANLAVTTETVDLLINRDVIQAILQLYPADEPQ